MLNRVKKYTYSFQISIRNSIEYRFDFVTSFLFKFLPVFINFFLWKIIYLSSGGIIETIKGMTLNRVVSYIIIIQFVDALISPDGVDFKVMSEIKEGELSKYLLKPINYFSYNLSLIVAKKVLFIPPVIATYVIVSLLFHEYIVLYQGLVDILLFIPALLLAFFIRYYIAIILGLIGFFLTEVSSLYIMTNRIILFLSGMLFPLVFLPDTLLTVFSCLPFYYITYFPSMIAIGALNVKEILFGYCISTIWFVGLYIIAVIMWRIGLKKYESVGG
ncbi:MAG: hypothetical protein HDQ99_03825 [Lachnospiraceae bacterium]|nr:hypothetical protein [Lachnospiraceae bacterium]